jgi:hypothetical protein
MNLYWAWSYLVAFWTTVVMSCIQPANWRYCWPPDWLIHGVHDYMRSRAPYSEERNILQSLERTNGLGGLDGGQADP